AALIATGKMAAASTLGASNRASLQSPRRGDKIAQGSECHWTQRVALTPCFRRARAPCGKSRNICHAFERVGETIGRPAPGRLVPVLLPRTTVPPQSRIEYCARSRFASFGNASVAISVLKCAVC